MALFSRRVVALSVVVCASTSVATAQPLNFRIETAEHSMPPLHSYGFGELGDWYFFFGGISGQGLHSLIQGGEPGQFPPSFPVNIFNDEIIAFNHETGETLTSGIDHLPTDTRLQMFVTNVPSIQFDDVVHIYGGYGPNATDDDWETRTTVTSVNLTQLLAAMQMGQPAPMGAFVTQAATGAQVTGAIIIRMGDNGRKYALIGGSNFIGDYAGNTPFLNLYSEKAQLFDADVSITTPYKTLEGSTLHRRDMNALPMTYPDGQGGTMTGFAIAGGVFQNGFFIWRNPLSYRDGDKNVTDELFFEQRMNQYEAGALSFYSETDDENRQVLFGGISESRWENDMFVSDPVVPWVTDITQIRVQGGMYLDETVIGNTPLPTTNAHTVIAEGIPTYPNGQINLDAMPANEVLIARLPGGLRAAEPAGTPMTFASGDVYEIYATYGVRGDINRDGVVNGSDLAELLANWGSTATVPDLQFDGVINGADLATLLALWGNDTPG